MSEIQYMQQIIPNGETVAYRTYGSGSETIILVHGNLSTSLFWEQFMTKLPGRFRVIAVDLRGAGRSSYNRPVEYISQFSEDIFSFVECLGIVRFALVGLSMGGLVCQQLAADHPARVSRLILIDSPSTTGFPVKAKDKENKIIPGKYWECWNEIFNDPVQVMPMRAIMKNQDALHMQKAYSATVFNKAMPEGNKYMTFMQEALTCRNYPDCLLAMHLFNISSRHNGVRPGNGLYRKINMPVLVITGEEDVLVPPDIAIDLAHELGGDLIFIKNSGHIPFIDNEDETLEAVISFLDKRPGK